MRLFGIIDGTIDRYDRAEWVTPPFDRVLYGESDMFPGAATAVRTGIGAATAVRTGIGAATAVRTGIGAATVAPRTS